LYGKRAPPAFDQETPASGVVRYLRNAQISGRSANATAWSPPTSAGVPIALSISGRLKTPTWLSRSACTSSGKNAVMKLPWFVRRHLGGSSNAAFGASPKFVWTT
jgi:hypothetical protein